MTNHAALVIGDVMLDRRIEGEMKRVSSEGPSWVIQQRHVSLSPGGAANVARNIVSLGAKAYLLGTIGNDAEGTTLAEAIRDSGVTACLPKLQKPTILKTRLTCDGNLVGRLDVEEADYASDSAMIAALDQVITPASDVKLVIISDYGKGTITPSLLTALKGKLANYSLPVYVDCRPAQISLYQGFATLVKPNIREALEMLAGVVHPGLYISDPVMQADTAVTLLQRTFSIPFVVLTLGPHGCVYYDPSDQQKHAAETKARRVYDVCGAGDTVLAGLAAGYLRGLDFTQAVWLAMYAAGLAVEVHGTAAIKLDDVEEYRYRETGWAAKPMSVEQLLSFIERRRRVGHRIVLANGCFDGLHAGHIEMLRWAKQHGDTLLVAYNDDLSLQKLKGESRPYVPASYRASHLAQQACVDAVFRFNGDVENLVRMLKPDVLVKGADSQVAGRIPGADYVASSGGLVLFSPVQFNLSSSLAGSGTKTDYVNSVNEPS